MEEIEELRAKAIASMSSSSFANPSVKSKPPDSREEGELSPELPMCSTTPGSSTILEDNITVEAADNLAGTKSDCPTSNTHPSKSPSITNAQTRSSAMRTYSRHFNTMQTSFKSNNNQSLLWQGKGSNENLVISFSDDDSTSSSSEKSMSKTDNSSEENKFEGSKLKKTVNNKDNIAKANNSKASGTAAPVQSRGLQGKSNITKFVPKKGLLYTAKPLASSAEKDSPVSRNNMKTKISAIPNLRHDIAVQENESKYMSRQSISRNNDIKVGDVRRPASIAGIGLAPRGQMSKRLKPSVGINNNTNENNEKWLHADNVITMSLSENLPPGHINTCSTPEASFKNKNNARLTKFEKRDMNADYPITVDRWPHVEQSGANIEDEAHVGNTSLHRTAIHSSASTSHPRKSAKSMSVDSFSPLSSKVPGQHGIARSQQFRSTSCTQILERKSGNNGNTNPLNYSSQMNMSGEASMKLQTLMHIEDMHDKELEQAQELRRKCELEERRALKAYREAQRALSDANEKCSFLYSRRELFSAQHRVLFMKSHGRAVSDTALAIPEARYRLSDAHEYTSSQFSEQNDENSPFDHRPSESRLLGDANHSKRITAVYSETDRMPDDENAQDYKLLEASLRSKLVKRLGNRIVPKGDNTVEAESLVKEGVADKCGDVKSPCLPDQQQHEGVKINASHTEGVLPKQCSRITEQLTTHISSRDDGLSLTNEAHIIEDYQDNSCIHKESCMQILTTSSPLPSSSLRIIYKHANSNLLGCFSKSSTKAENQTLLLENSTKCVRDEESMAPFSTDFTKLGKIEVQNYDFAIDPLWPFCMYDLRGKCNNEECKWQHVKHLVKSSSDGHGNNLLNVRKSDDVFESSYILRIPAYYVGWSLIKADSYPTQSLLTRTNWQYWRRGFCASFPIPFSVQRILHPDTPFLHTGVGDDHSWNRLSSYHQTQDSSMKQLDQGLPDSENSLEIALELFDGSGCKPNRKKVLELLSRAIEADPASVVHWVVYLHIYYEKEKDIGKDDMFFHAVQHNEESYDLWLMYINSRFQVDERLNAYEIALTTFCRNKVNEDARHISACILDIFLQMTDFLCMSGNEEKVIHKIYGLLGNPSDGLLSDIHSCLITSDRCIFWLCCIYLTIYRKIPETIIQQFEFEKYLTFRIDWPCVPLTPNRKEHALNLMKLAIDKMIVDIYSDPQMKSELSIRSLHFMAICHVRCVAALEGLNSSSNLLANYLTVYPTCIELILMSARLNENISQDASYKGFEEALSNWPRETLQIHCLWNQYVEHALANNNTDLAKIILTRWHEIYCKDTNVHDWNSEKDVFGLLNFSMYEMLQKNKNEANEAIIKALKLASTEDYIHCVREHAAFAFANEINSRRDNKPWSIILGLLNFYLGDYRSLTTLEPLSRKYYRHIKKPRLRQIFDSIFGPVSRDFTLANSVLEVCIGTSLLPEMPDDLKGFVDFIESLMEIVTANFKLALSVCKSTTNLSLPIKFWACSILCNSIFQAVPVAPEHVWIEAANFIKNLGNLDISTRFHKQAVSVYPFSTKLWQSYLNICRSKDDVNILLENAKERGIELAQPSDSH